MDKQITCATCRFFGRDEEPMHADQAFDNKERYQCLNRKGKQVFKADGGVDYITFTVYVLADRKACKEYEEDNDK